MSRHVEQFLTEYVEGQLTLAQMAAIDEHVHECAACRAALARRERFAADLRLALGYSSTPRPGQVEEWWQHIVAAPVMTMFRPRLPSALLPVALSLLLLLLPITGGLHRARAVSSVAGTAVSPVIDVTNVPPTVIVKTNEPIHRASTDDATAAPNTPPSPVVLATLTPAPLAP